MLPRLFANRCEHCVANGSLEENGVGKLRDINRVVLADLHRMGVTHIWYTGIIEHATTTDYSAHGIPRNHAQVVKGKAGSPYAIKDYYAVDPDLAQRPEHAMNSFLRLVQRTHSLGMGVILDFVPNHVSREYHSKDHSEDVRDLGQDDDVSLPFSPDNNFYYLPDETFVPPVEPAQGTEAYVERPARATGNDCFTAYPTVNDWYETVKLNYGVDYMHGKATYFDPIPSTWRKMLDILLFWTAKGIDGFRCDMAEMVPAEFWNWAISRVKVVNPHIMFIGEVYNPGLYDRYLNFAGFDYLYDKVGLYDTLRAVTCRHSAASAITSCWQRLGPLQGRMLNFLENHDEQRLASDFFAGNGRRGLAALAVSALMNQNPFMLYFGQELGERGMDAEGYSGPDGRTTIFDYWSVDSVRRFYYGKREDCPAEMLALHNYYARLLGIATSQKAVSSGSFFDLMYVNYDHPLTFNTERQYAFLRKADRELLIVVANFDDQPRTVEVRLPGHAFDCLPLREGSYPAQNLLTDETLRLTLKRDSMISLTVPANGATVLKINV